jgi:O-acetylserine/cysteine efflux transporter
MGMRFVLAALVLVWFVPIPRGYLWTMCWISFIAATLQYGLTFSGLALMQATPAVLLVQSEVIFGVIIAAVILREIPTLRQCLGMVIALVGIIVILGAPALDGQMLGVTLVLLGGLVWAFGQVLIRRLDGALGGFQLTAWLGVMAGPQMLLASLLLDGNPLPAIAAAPVSAWLTVLYLGLVMTVIGYSAWYYVLARYPVPVVMPLLLLLPVAAILGAVSWLGEVPDSMVLVGGAVVIAGVAMVIIEPAQLLASWRKKNPG